MEKYHLHLDNAQKGPFSLGQLQEMWKAGEINARTQFWTKANDEWRPIEEIISLLEPAKPAAPVHEAGGPSPLAATTAAKVAAMSAPEATDWRDRMADAAARDNPKPSGNRPLRKSFPMLSVLSALMRGVGWLVFLVGLVFVLMAVGDMLVKAGDTGRSM